MSLIVNVKSSEETWFDLTNVVIGHKIHPFIPILLNIIILFMDTYPARFGQSQASRLSPLFATDGIFQSIHT